MYIIIIYIINNLCCSSFGVCIEPSALLLSSLANISEWITVSIMREDVAAARMFKTWAQEEGSSKTPINTPKVKKYSTNGRVNLNLN